MIIGVFMESLAPAEGRLLDVGCGEGTLSDFIPAHKKSKYVGIDTSDEAIKLATQKRKLNFLHATAENFTPKDQFDIIVFNEMLYYVDHVAILQRFSKFLSKNGIIVISVWYTKRIDYLQKSIFEDARKVLQPLDGIDVHGLTGPPGTKKKEISFHIEGFRI